MHRSSVLILFCLLLMWFSGCTEDTTEQQLTAIRINEVQTSGGEYDWIELYNTADEAVALDGCFLSNDQNEPGKWQFPSVTLEAGAYLLLRADGSGSSNDDDIRLPFRLNAGGVTLRLSRHDGAVLQQLDIPAGASGLSYGYEANGYVWYASPTPGAHNSTGMMLGKETTVEAYGLRINEYMSRNQSVLYDENGDYNDWIEIHNFSDRTLDISGYTLTDSRTAADKWRFPQGTLISANGYLVVHCSGRNVLTGGGEFHTSFKLGTSDSFIGLYTAEGLFCSGVNYEPTQPNYSRGYQEEDGYVLFRYPTPGYANNGSVLNEGSEVTP